MNSSNQKKMNGNYEDNIASLVKTINDNPDILHLDYTPSVHALCDYGIAAMEAVLPLLNSKDDMERYRAQRVLEGTLKRNYGWKVGQDIAANPSLGKKLDELWNANGNYNAEAPEKDRLEAIEKWKVWLTEKIDNGEEE